MLLQEQSDSHYTYECLTFMHIYLYIQEVSEYAGSQNCDFKVKPSVDPVEFRRTSQKHFFPNKC